MYAVFIQYLPGFKMNINTCSLQILPYTVGSVYARVLKFCNNENGHISHVLPFIFLIIKFTTFAIYSAAINDQAYLRVSSSDSV